MSGSEGRWVRWSDGVGLSGGEGELERPVGGRGAAALEPGGRRADLPTEPPAGPSDTRTEMRFNKSSGKKPTELTVKRSKPPLEPLWADHSKNSSYLPLAVTLAHLLGKVLPFPSAHHLQNHHHLLRLLLVLVKRQMR